jgi:hypothetical protein
VRSDYGPNRRSDYFSYATVLGWEFPATILGIMFVGGLIGLVASAVTGGPWAFLLVWVFVVPTYGAYGFLYHRAYVVRVTDGVLSWHGCGYHGSRPMSEVEAVTPGFAGFYVWVFHDGSRMTMISFKSPYRLREQTTTFLDEVGSAYPDISMPGYLGGR